VSTRESKQDGHGASDEIAAAAERLRAGRLVAFPTETVYGLGADALNAAAVARVFAAKGRPSNNPLIVHVDSIAMTKRVVQSWPEGAEALAKAFWPGPLTIVLPKSENVPASVTGDGPNVAVRAPKHPVALALIGAFGGPIVGPSANKSGFVSPTTAWHVHQEFADADVMVLDGGACEVGIESTVVSLASVGVGSPRVLRPGAISAAEISAVLGVKVAEGKGKAVEGAPLHSPGQLASHYAPRSPAMLVDASKLLKALREAEGPCVVLGPLLTSVPRQHRVIPMPLDARAYASRVYAALREADALMPAMIAIVKPTVVKGAEDEALWRAIMDRLKRATTE
jgi:L-threonylcarbamoyladenylate synthase